MHSPTNVKLTAVVDGRGDRIV